MSVVESYSLNSKYWQRIGFWHVVRSAQSSVYLFIGAWPGFETETFGSKVKVPLTRPTLQKYKNIQIQLLPFFLTFKLFIIFRPT